MKLELIPFYQLVCTGQTGEYNTITGGHRIRTHYGPPTRKNIKQYGIIRDKVKKL